MCYATLSICGCGLEGRRVAVYCESSAVALSGTTDSAGSACLTAECEYVYHHGCEHRPDEGGRPAHGVTFSSRAASYHAGCGHVVDVESAPAVDDDPERGFSVRHVTEVRTARTCAELTCRRCSRQAGREAEEDQVLARGSDRV